MYTKTRVVNDNGTYDHYLQLYFTDSPSSQQCFCHKELVIAVCHKNDFLLLWTGRIDVYNDAIDGDCRTAAAKLFQMGSVCGFSC